MQNAVRGAHNNISQHISFAMYFMKILQNAQLLNVINVALIHAFFLKYFKKTVYIQLNALTFIAAYCIIFL